MGRWKRNETGYLKANCTHFRVHYRLGPGHSWAADVEGESRTFCDPEQEWKLRTHCLPRSERAQAVSG